MFYLASAQKVGCNLQNESFVEVLKSSETHYGL